MEQVQTRPAATAMWAAAGVLWAVAILGIASIGVFVLPVAVVVTLMAASRGGSRGILVLVATAALVTTGLLAFQAATSDPETGGGSIPPPQ